MTTVINNVVTDVRQFVEDMRAKNPSISAMRSNTDPMPDGGILKMFKIRTKKGFFEEGMFVYPRTK